MPIFKANSKANFDKSGIQFLIYQILILKIYNFLGVALRKNIKNTTNEKNDKEEKIGMIQDRGEKTAGRREKNKNIGLAKPARICYNERKCANSAAGASRGLHTDNHDAPIVKWI